MNYILATSVDATVDFVTLYLDLDAAKREAKRLAKDVIDLENGDVCVFEVDTTQPILDIRTCKEVYSAAADEMGEYGND